MVCMVCYIPLTTHVDKCNVREVLTFRLHLHIRLKIRLGNKIIYIKNDTYTRKIA